MMLAEIKELQLKHLDDVITNADYWNPYQFRLLNNEAASGKSQQTFKSIAKLATSSKVRIIYVQMFANKDSNKQDAEELKNTVNKINTYAGKEVAKYICSENKNRHKAILATAQVICITHKKYLELCKGKRSNFITESDVLIIDEFPNLFESFYVSELELTRLQGFTLLSEKDKDDIMELNNFLKDKLNEFLDNYGNSEMRIINLQKLDIKRYFKILDIIITKAKKDNEIAHKQIIECAQKVMELFKHSSVFSVTKIGSKSYPVLYSFYKDTDYILAKENNIILDANGGFDGRYKFRKDILKLDYQIKVFNYEDSCINFYPIATTKTALKGYKNIILDVANYIEKWQSKGIARENDTLIITDIARENEITKFQKEYFECFNDIKIAHFGALIGKNDWKNYKYAWIIKTPFYSWVEYILQYLFYSRQDLNGNVNCQIKVEKGEYNNYTIFRNKQFNKFKNSIVKGEYYQAFKRIARDGRQCTFNILTADEDIYKDLKKEFKNIKEQVKTDLEIKLYVKLKHKKSGKEPVKTNERNEIIKNYLIEAKSKGKDKIEKTELCIVADIRKDKLSKQLNNLDEWLNKNNIVVGTSKEQAYILL